MSPVMSSPMGSSRGIPPEEPSVPIDESIFLSQEQIKAMSEEQIREHLTKLNAIRSQPRQPRAAKVTATGAPVVSRKQREVI